MGHHRIVLTILSMPFGPKLVRTASETASRISHSPRYSAPVVDPPFAAFMFDSLTSVGFPCIHHQLTLHHPTINAQLPQILVEEAEPEPLALSEKWLSEMPCVGAGAATAAMIARVGCDGERRAAR